MRDSKRGVILIVAVLITGLFALTSVIMLGITKSRIRVLEGWLEETKAYYLAEAGATAALVDIRDGVVTSQSNSRDVTFTDGEGKTYTVHYVVEKTGNNWQITSSVKSTRGLNRTYYFKMGGMRAFPYFIRGRPL